MKTINGDIATKTGQEIEAILIENVLEGEDGKIYLICFSDIGLKTYDIENKYFHLQPFELLNQKYKFQTMFDDSQEEFIKDLAGCVSMLVIDSLLIFMVTLI